MKLYLAACYTNNYMFGQRYHTELLDIEKNIFNNIPNVLESYHYVSKQKFVNEMRAADAKVFLDSGAFSAHTSNITINIDDYCQYIICNSDILRIEDNIIMASVLDGIGDPLKTYQNQIYMEQHGVKPLPCFHFGEDSKYLDWYVTNYQYITIGGLVGRSKKDQIMWLDRIWNDHMLDGSGRAKLKVHAFGVTSPDIMKRYPWTSCDSSSWIQSTSFGSVFTSEYGPIAVSKDSPSKHEAGRHLTTFNDIERAAIEQMFESKGFSFERLSTVYQSRAACNCLGYIELNILINQYLESNKDSLLVQKVQQLF